MINERDTAKQVDRWTWAIITALGTILLSGGAMFLTIVHGQVQTLETAVARQGERLFGLEVQNSLTEKRLERIESKIDKLLDLPRIEPKHGNS